MGEQYHFAFAWQSAYGRLVQLVDRLQVLPGVVLDLGCGYASIAEPLRERSFEYVGLDLDPGSVADVEARGFEAHQIDLRQFDELPDRVKQVVAGRHVTAVVMLDVLEHVPDTRAYLASLRQLIEDLGRPILGLSVPNVAHFDLGAKLAFGRWDVTPTGLLDETHVSLFDERRLRAELGAKGFLEIARNDFEMAKSDQAFPRDHPALNRTAPLSQLLRSLRVMVDEVSLVNQFVRFFALSDATPGVGDDGAFVPFLSVVVRTQGTRNELLLEALVCLAAQSVTDFEVLVMAHTTEGELVEGVQALVATFDESFAGRVRVIQVVGGGRSRPLNVAIEEARGRYLGFLDDDDHVTARWVESFLDAANDVPGVVIRSRTAERDVHRISGRYRGADYEVRSKLRYPFAPTFDFFQHLHHNETPICSLALPMEGVHSFRLRFDEGLDVVEDWDLLLQAAELMGVQDTGAVTSIYHRWVEGESSLHNVDSRVWEAARQLVLQKLATRPMILPTGSARRLSDLTEERAGWADAARLLAERDAEIQSLRAQLEELRNSEWWRMTAPMRRVGSKIRQRRLGA